MLDFDSTIVETMGSASFDEMIFVEKIVEKIVETNDETIDETKIVEMASFEKPPFHYSLLAHNLDTHPNQQSNRRYRFHRWQHCIRWDPIEDLNSILPHHYRFPSLPVNLQVHPSYWQDPLRRLKRYWLPF